MQAGSPERSASFRAGPSSPVRCGLSETDTQEMIERRIAELVVSPPSLRRQARGHLRAHLSGHDQHRCRPDFAAEVAGELVGEDNVVRNLGPEHGRRGLLFHAAGQRPGAYLRLGQGGGPSNCFLHNTRYDFNDAVIPLGAAVCSALAERGMPLAELSTFEEGR